MDSKIVIDRKTIKTTLETTFGKKFETGQFKMKHNTWVVMDKWFFRPMGDADAAMQIGNAFDKIDFRVEFDKYARNFEFEFRLIWIDREAERAEIARKNDADLKYDADTKHWTDVWDGISTGPFESSTWMTVDDVARWSYQLRYTPYVPYLPGDGYVVDVRMQDERGWYTVFIAKDSPEDVPTKMREMFEIDRIAMVPFFTAIKPREVVWRITSFTDMRIEVGQVYLSTFKNMPAYPNFRESVTVYVRKNFEYARGTDEPRETLKVELNWAAWGPQDIETTDDFARKLLRANHIARIIRGRAEAETFERFQ